MDIVEIYPPYIYSVRYDGHSENIFDELFENTQNGVKPDFDEHFCYLEGKYRYLMEWYPMKSYGPIKPSLLRIYAIKMGKNIYLIVDGGMKLSDKIQNSPGLKNHVIQNIDKVIFFLKTHGITGSDDLTEKI